MKNPYAGPAPVMGGGFNKSALVAAGGVTWGQTRDSGFGRKEGVAGNRLRIGWCGLPDGAITTYSYNADGLRVEEDQDGVIKRLVYDGNNVQLETDDLGDLLVDNTYVPNKYGMALSQRRDGDSSFYLADGTQDVRQLTDSVQSVTDEYEFDVWGNPFDPAIGAIHRR